MEILNRQKLWAVMKLASLALNNITDDYNKIDIENKLCDLVIAVRMNETKVVEKLCTELDKLTRNYLLGLPFSSIPLIESNNEYIEADNTYTKKRNKF